MKWKFQDHSADSFKNFNDNEIRGKGLKGFSVKYVRF